MERLVQNLTFGRSLFGIQIIFCSINNYIVAALQESPILGHNKAENFDLVVKWNKRIG